MAIHYSLTVVDNTLLVHASGFDESAEEVQAYGLAVIRACRDNNITRVLSDERELEYRLGVFDTYESAAFLCAHVPALVRAAIICNHQFVADARLWEQVATRRGLQIRTFITTDTALRWLNDEPD